MDSGHFLESIGHRPRRNIIRAALNKCVMNKKTRFRGREGWWRLKDRHRRTHKESRSVATASRSHQPANSEQDAWHSSPTKGDSAINSINPISIPSSLPGWVNTQLRHTAKLLLPCSICSGSGTCGTFKGWMVKQKRGRGTAAWSPRLKLKHSVKFVIMEEQRSVRVLDCRK